MCKYLITMLQVLITFTQFIGIREFFIFFLYESIMNFYHIEHFVFSINRELNSLSDP